MAATILDNVNVFHQDGISVRPNATDAFKVATFFALIIHKLIQNRLDWCYANSSAKKQKGFVSVGAEDIYIWAAIWSFNKD